MLTFGAVGFITVITMIADVTSTVYRSSLSVILMAAVAGSIVVLGLLPSPCLATDGQMLIITDRGAPEEVEYPERDEAPPPKDEGRRGDDPAPVEVIVPPDTRQESQSVRRRRELMSMYEPLQRQEFDRMLQVVQVLDRDEAARWMQRFISSRPFNCPFESQKAWIHAIISAAQTNNLPVCKEVLALLASIVSIESGFRADPPAMDPSRGEDMNAVLERAEQDLFDKMGPVMSVPPVPQVYQIYRAKYYPKLLACRTEKDIELVARSIVKNLKDDAESLPDFLRKIIFKELDKVRNVVRSKGSMQLNFPRARQVVKDRGDRYSDEELTEYMYTLRGGVDVGAAALKPMFVQYGALYAKPGDLSWLFFVGMDYHYGPFSSRNMMEQIRIRDLSGQKIPLDGDFLHYDEAGEPLDQESQTLRAAASVFSSELRESVHEAFLLEKYPHYVYTDLHKAIAKAHLDRFGETPFAVIGELWMGGTARIKHGTTWKTQSYLRKLDNHLNSVPWDH